MWHSYWSLCLFATSKWPFIRLQTCGMALNWPLTQDLFITLISAQFGTCVHNTCRCLLISTAEQLNKTLLNSTDPTTCLMCQMCCVPECSSFPAQHLHQINTSMSVCVCAWSLWLWVCAYAGLDADYSTYIILLECFCSPSKWIWHFWLSILLIHNIRDKHERNIQATLFLLYLYFKILSHTTVFVFDHGLLCLFCVWGVDPSTFRLSRAEVTPRTS